MRNKLKTALEIVVKQLGDELEEANRPEIDSDTLNTYGSEDILATILSKIDEASLFIADVTPIVSTEKKLIPNPNVMTEIGYALKSNGAYTRLFIYCTDERIEPERMPFDIRGKNLIGFSTDEKPSEIAEKLKPYLEGMLANEQSNSDAKKEKPYVYVSGASFTAWSDASTVALDIINTGSIEYFIEEIEIEGYKAQPNRALPANAISKGISIAGVTQIFQTANPIVKMTLSRGDEHYYIEQAIQVVLGADDQYHFTQFIQKPINV